MRHISRYIALFVLFVALVFGFAEKSQGSAQIAPQTVTITGTVQADTTLGDLNTKWNGSSIPVGAVLVGDASTTVIVGAQGGNEGNLTAYNVCYCGQSALDAGGLADSGAGTSPQAIFSLRVPAGQPFSWAQAMPCAGPIACYSSSTAGYVTVDAGVQAMTMYVGTR